MFIWARRRGFGLCILFIISSVFIVGTLVLHRVVVTSSELNGDDEKRLNEHEEPQRETELPYPTRAPHVLPDEYKFDIYDPPNRTPDQVVHPIILWWTKFTLDKGKEKMCGTDVCFFTNMRRYRDYKNPMTHMFYGTSFELHDLPIPRRPGENWVLMHEESPKNNYLLSQKDILAMFNLSATFRRESNFPLTLQHFASVEEIESKTYVIPVEEKNRLQREKDLAPVIFVQSDCGCPSDRDHYFTMLSKHIKIDSYGKCNNNKALPYHLREAVFSMDKPDFYKIVAEYKFAIAFENAVCPDYVTEKYWRPLMLGVVPVYYGSPRIYDLLPNPKAAVVVDGLKTVKEIADLLHYLNQNDTAYEEMRSFKREGVTNKYLIELAENRTWGINNNRFKGNFIDKFECFVCNRVHDNLRRKQQGLPEEPYQVRLNHYGCPPPNKFDENGHLTGDRNWAFEDSNAHFQSKVFFDYMSRGKFNFTRKELESDAHRLYDKHIRDELKH